MRSFIVGMVSLSFVTLSSAKSRKSGNCEHCKKKEDRKGRKLCKDWIKDIDRCTFRQNAWRRYCRKSCCELNKCGATKAPAKVTQETVTEPTPAVEETKATKTPAEVTEETVTEPTPAVEETKATKAPAEVTEATKAPAEVTEAQSEEESQEAKGTKLVGEKCDSYADCRSGDCRNETCARPAGKCGKEIEDKCGDLGCPSDYACCSNKGWCQKFERDFTEEQLHVCAGPKAIHYRDERWNDLLDKIEGPTTAPKPFKSLWQECESDCDCESRTCKDGKCGVPQGQCGKDWKGLDGEPAKCDPESEFPCCSQFGWCGNTADHCKCEGCADSREKTVKKPTPAVEETKVLPPTVSPPPRPTRRSDSGPSLLVSGADSDSATATSTRLSADFAKTEEITMPKGTKRMDWFAKSGDNVYGAQPDKLVHMMGGNGNEWTEISELGDIGGDPTHVHLATYAGNSQVLYLSNYGGGRMAVVPLIDGNLPTREQWGKMKKTHIFELGHSKNWDASGHLHQTVTRDDNVWAVDLGKNKIYHFKRDATTGIVSKLLDEADVNVDVGDENPTKPRHIALHPTKPVAFVVLEGASYVLSYAIEDDGKLVFKHKVKLTKQWTKHGSHYGSEIVVSPDGNFVYASSRCNPDGDHSPCDGIIAVYKVMEGTEGLELVEEYKLEQKWPRSMVLTPEGDVLAVALEAKGEEKSKVTTLKLNRNTGKIEKALHTVGTGKTKATFITFA